jgi:Fe-S cluster assembly ATP-binding protein
MLSIKNLKASLLDGTPILNGINLDVNPGEIHAIMGVNGSGKSTLSKVISGHPEYKVTEGTIELDGKNLLELDPSERANEGFFASTQYPIEIPGVPNVEFLRMALDSKRAYLKQGPVSDEEFHTLLEKNMELLEMDDRYRTRGLNDGFSGGEKKRNEILQMAMLSPKYSFLDETDSGLDIDALRIVSNGINRIHDASHAIILVTHYERLLEYVKPDFVHVLMHGKILLTGGADLARKLESDGYDWIEGA